MSDRRIPCPLSVTRSQSADPTPCGGSLEYRDDPERLVCDNCLRVWSLDEIAILEDARCA